MRSGDGLAVAAVAALALVSTLGARGPVIGVSRFAGGRNVRARGRPVLPEPSKSAPKLSDVAELVYHNYHPKDLLHVFPDVARPLRDRVVVLTRDGGLVAVSQDRSGQSHLWVSRDS